MYNYLLLYLPLLSVFHNYYSFHSLVHIVLYISAGFHMHLCTIRIFLHLVDVLSLLLHFLLLRFLLYLLLLLLIYIEFLFLVPRTYSYCLCLFHLVRFLDNTGMSLFLLVHFLLLLLLLLLLYCCKLLLLLLLLRLELFYLLS